MQAKERLELVRIATSMGGSEATVFQRLARLTSFVSEGSLGRPAVRKTRVQRRWTKSEKAAGEKLLTEGYGFPAIGKALSRSEGSVRYAVYRGILDNNSPAAPAKRRKKFPMVVSSQVK